MFWPFLSGLAALCLYLAFPSYHHNFDGVACAIAVELGDLKHLVHGNHLLYGLIGYAFHQFLHFMGMRLNALWSLQILDSLLGATGVTLMHAILRRAGFSHRIAALCSAGLAVSYGYWFWSLEAQVYLLGLVLLLVAFWESLAGGPAPYRLALWHALAMLSHGANALFTPVLLYALHRSQPETSIRRAEISRYLITTAVIVVAGYIAAAALWVQPQNLGELRLWLLGSAALGPGRTVDWHGAEGFFHSLRDWIYTSGLAVSIVRPLALPLWGAMFWGLFKARGPQRPLAISVALWLFSYASLFLFWEPFTLVYRVNDLPALWLAAALASGALLKRPIGKALGLGYLLILACLNGALGIRPIGRPERNTALQETLWMSHQTPENAWIATDGVGAVYIPYFAHRHPLILTHFYGREKELRERIQSLLRSGQPVYIPLEIVNRWREMFSKYELRETAARGQFVLYRILK